MVRVLRVYNYRQCVRIVKPDNVRLLGYSTWKEMLRKSFKIILEKLRKRDIDRRVAS
jgi:hypothetical protein